MNDNQPSEQEIEKLLEKLNDRDPYVRSDAIGQIEEQGLINEQVIEALKKMAAGDPNEIVRGAAKDVLLTVIGEDSNEPITAPEPTNVPEPVTDLRSFLKRYRQQLMGFFGWYLIATVLSSGSMYGLITTPATVIILIAFAVSKKSKGVAGGILIAVALNFVISLVSGLVFNAWCFVPFYKGL